MIFNRRYASRANLIRVFDMLDSSVSNVIDLPLYGDERNDDGDRIIVGTRYIVIDDTLDAYVQNALTGIDERVIVYRIDAHPSARPDGYVLLHVDLELPEDVETAVLDRLTGILDPCVVWSKHRSNDPTDERVLIVLRPDSGSNVLSIEQVAEELETVNEEID